MVYWCQVLFALLLCHPRASQIQVTYGIWHGYERETTIMFCSFLRRVLLTEVCSRQGLRISWFPSSGLLLTHIDSSPQQSGLLLVFIPQRSPLSMLLFCSRSRGWYAYYLFIFRSLRTLLVRFLGWQVAHWLACNTSPRYRAMLPSNAQKRLVFYSMIISTWSTAPISCWCYNQGCFSISPLILSFVLVLVALLR